jgi:hypothetical protein
MTWSELLVFLIGPAGAVAMGYILLKLQQRETARFDRERERERQRHAAK